MTKIVIANWKMYLNHLESIAWLNDHTQELDELAVTTNATLVICPSYTVIPFTNRFQTKQLSWGAQDCSYAERGAYTGDISAQSLKQLECSYALVGHSERRKYYHETEEQIKAKLHELFNHEITPVLCVGYGITKGQNSEDILKTQLQPLRELTQQAPHKNLSLLIAYEPEYAIGADKPADTDEISKACTYIQKYVTDNSNVSVTPLYGGSINETTVQELSKTAEISGFLLGRASTNFETLKKIILSCYTYEA